MVSNRGAMADEFHDLLVKLSNNACLLLIGVRMRPDRMKRQPLAVKLSQQASSLLDATNPYRKSNQTEVRRRTRRKSQKSQRQPSRTAARRGAFGRGRPPAEPEPLIRPEPYTVVTPQSVLP